MARRPTAKGSTFVATCYWCVNNAFVVSVVERGTGKHSLSLNSSGILQLRFRATSTLGGARSSENTEANSFKVSFRAWHSAALCLR